MNTKHRDEREEGREDDKVSQDLLQSVFSRYSDAIRRSEKLFKGLPSLHSALRYQRVWGIQEAIDQCSSLTKQRDILVDICRNRIQVRKLQLKLSQLRAKDVLGQCQSLAADARETFSQGCSSMLARLAAEEVMRLMRLLEIEESKVAEKLRNSATEVEHSRQAIVELKAATEDTSVMPVTVESAAVPPPRIADGKYYYCASCKVGGHGERFAGYLLQRPNWRVYPSQIWFKDEKGTREYYCPLGRSLVDFTDETKFSRISMYIKGHIWMEDKTKLYEVVPDCMPETYVIDDMKWRYGRSPPADDKVAPLPWFVKEADRNWGTSVHCCARPSECLSFAKDEAVYAVQQHIADPLCMDDGRKCHIKFYILLRCLEDGVTWELHTYRDGYLSISPNAWSPEDLSKATQVTIIRTERINNWRHWEAAYPKCKAKTAKVIEELVKQGKIQGTFGRQQFEIMSADYIVDTHGEVWLFEFNTSPVLKDPESSPDVHDGDLIKDALSILIPWEGGDIGLWDLALRCAGPTAGQLSSMAAS